MIKFAPMLASPLLLSALILTIIGVSTTRWYYVEEDGAKMEYGLLSVKNCLTPDSCVTSRYSDFCTQLINSPDCSHIQGAGAGAFIVLLLSTVLLAIGFLGSLANALCHNRRCFARMPSVLHRGLVPCISLTAFVLNCVSITIWAATFPFYDDYDERSLEVEVGFSLILTAIAAGLSLFAFLLTMLVHRVDENPEETPIVRRETVSSD